MILNINRNVNDLCELPGVYVNMQSYLLDIFVGKVLNDGQTYLCCQVPINDEECYGVAADDKTIVIYRYKNDDSESELCKQLRYRYLQDCFFHKKDGKSHIINKDIESITLK